MENNVCLLDTRLCAGTAHQVPEFDARQPYAVCQPTDGPDQASGENRPDPRAVVQHELCLSHL